MTDDAPASRAVRLLISCTLLSSLTLAISVRAELAADSPEFLVNTTQAANQECPAIDALSGGGFIVVWDGQQQIGKPFRGVLGQRFDSQGNRIGTEFVVDDLQQAYQAGQGNGNVASQRNGGFVVAWDNFGGEDGSFYGVFARRFDAGANKLGTQFQVNSYTTYVQYDTVISATGDSAFVIAWVDSGYFAATGTQIFAQRYDANGDRLGTDFQVPTTTDGYPAMPAIAALPDGDFVVTWSERAQSGVRQIVGQRFTAQGERNGSEFSVGSHSTVQQAHPDVASNVDGAFLVAWDATEQDGNAEGIYAQRFDSAGQRNGTEFQVNEYTSGRQRRPAVAISENGSFLIVWASEGQDGDSQGVFGRHILGDGTADGAEFEVNTYTTGWQGGRLGRDLDVAVDASGKFFVAWQSEHQDADRDSIMGRLYCVNPPIGLPTCGDVTCAGNDTTSGGPITASDALVTLRSAVGLGSCSLCRCDTDSSGIVTASDAQIILKAAVGQVVTLECPLCE